MKKFLCFLVIMLLRHFTIAQSIPSELFPVWGDEQIIYQENIPHIQLVKRKGAYYTILETANIGSKKDKSSVLVKYDQDLKILEKVNLKELFPLGNTDCFHLLSFGEKLYLFFGYYPNSSKKEFFAQEINSEKLILKGYPVKITDFTFESSTKNEAVQSFPNKEAFRFQFSPDKTKLLIIHQRSDVEGFIHGYDFLLINENLEKLANLNFPLTLPQNWQGINIPHVEDSGNFHFLAEPHHVFEKGESAGKKVPHLLFTYTLATNSNRITSLDLDVEMLSQIGFAVDPTGAIYIGGFYTAAGGVENTSGLFFLKLNSTDHKVLIRKTIQLDQINSSTSKQQVDGKTHKVSDIPMKNTSFHVKDLLLTEDGNLVLVGESYEQKISMLQANKPFSGRTQAVFGNILAVGLSQAGNLHWSQVIGKKQLVGGKDFNLASFSIWQAENNLYLLFNDNKKNTDLENKSKIHPFHSLMNKKDHALSLLSFDNSGMPQKSQIEIYPKINGNTKKLLSVLPKENNMIVMDRKKKSIRLVRLVTHPAPPFQIENAMLASDTLNAP